MSLPNCFRTVSAVLAFLVTTAAPAAAQIDYRNLDDDRPVTSEDAYPVERYAFELLAPYRFDREAGGARLHAVIPEVTYGMARNVQVGLKLPFAAVDAAGDTDGGLAGLRVFGLYNFNTESRGLPALSLRADAGLPVGSLAGDDARFAVKAIATRSWGLTRVEGETVAARKAGVQAAGAHFWSMVEDPEARFPRTMPMTSAIAPRFSRAHPRAAVIFDNLHMMHDIISDILTADTESPEGKPIPPPHQHQMPARP